LNDGGNVFLNLIGQAFGGIESLSGPKKLAELQIQLLIQKLTLKTKQMGFRVAVLSSEGWLGS
jgi:hypothetical protein